MAIEADSRPVQQLFENLFRNAVEHGSTDEPSATGDASDDAGLRVTVEELDDGFFVEDTGPGLPDDAGDSLFESGYTTSEDGTGLGLAIVRRIAEAHGWEIGDQRAGGCCTVRDHGRGSATICRSISGRGVTG